jgi:hypothetical protein
MSETPEAFMQRYFKHEVPLGSPASSAVTVKLDAMPYRNAKREGFEADSDVMLMKDAVWNKADAASRPLVHRAFMGKGSPQGIARVLELVARHKLLGTAIDKQPLPIERKLALFCKQWIGLDCLGFAVNYVQSQQKLLTTVEAMEADMPHFRALPFIPRATVLDFQTGDAIVWDDPRHIAVLGSSWPLQLQPLTVFPVVMAAGDGNYGPPGLFAGRFRITAGSKLGSFKFHGKASEKTVRVFGPNHSAWL